MLVVYILFLMSFVRDPLMLQFSVHHEDMFFFFTLSFHHHTVFPRRVYTIAHEVRAIHNIFSMTSMIFFKANENSVICSPTSHFNANNDVQIINNDKHLENVQNIRIW